MFETLSEKLQRSFKTLRGQGTLTDENINDALREIRVALLESDVNLDVARDLIEKIRAKALGSRSPPPSTPPNRSSRSSATSSSPPSAPTPPSSSSPPSPPPSSSWPACRAPAKTTTSGKLAAWLKKGGHRPMLVSVDVYRPAAREQLAVVAESIGAQLYAGKYDPATDNNTAAVLRLAKAAFKDARDYACNVLIVDTAGRLGIDEPSWTRWPSSNPSSTPPRSSSSPTP